MADNTRFAELAENGYPGRVEVLFADGTESTWNAGGCCRDKTSDDVAYLDSILQPFVDAGTRIAMFGQSSGGMMALRYWYEGRHRVHAFGTQAASLSAPGDDFVLDELRFPYPAHWIHWHGQADAVVPFSGRAGIGDRDRAELSEFVPVPAVIEMARAPAAAAVDRWRDRGPGNGVVTVYRTVPAERANGDWRLRVRLLPGVDHDNQPKRWPSDRYSYPFRFLVNRSLAANDGLLGSPNR